MARKKLTEVIEEQGLQSRDELLDYIIICLSNGQRKETKNLINRIKEPDRTRVIDELDACYSNITKILKL